MKLSINKSVMATAVATALCAPAFAGPILLDRDGNLGGSTPIVVSTLNWAGTNMLMQNLIKSATIVGIEAASRTGEFTLWAQGNLGSFGSTSCGGTTCAVINEWTYQLGVTMNITTETTLGTATSLTGTLAAVPSVNFFNIYYDGASNANHLTGGGFGAPGVGTLVLSGVITNAQNGTSIEIPMDQNNANNASSTTSALRRLDNFGGADNYTGIGTYVSNGNTQLDIEVTSQNLAFISTPLTTLTVGLNLSTGGGVLPFSQVEPSASVVGVVPNYGLSTNTQTGHFRSTSFGASNGSRRMNDLFCGVGVGATTCDLHAQGQGLSAFFATSVPEPGSLALLGLGLGALGFGIRRRKERA